MKFITTHYPETDWTMLPENNFSRWIYLHVYTWLPNCWVKVSSLSNISVGTLWLYLTIQIRVESQMVLIWICFSRVRQFFLDRFLERDHDLFVHRHHPHTAPTHSVLPDSLIYWCSETENTLTYFDVLAAKYSQPCQKVPKRERYNLKYFTIPQSLPNP